RRINFNPGTALTVTAQADLCGMLYANGGTFIAGTASFTCNNIPLHAVNGGLIRIDGPAVYSMVNMPPGTALLADGAMSEVDLRNLMAISDEGWSWSPGTQAHTIEARNGGHIDLRSVETIVGASSDERLDVVVSSGGTIDLTSLAEVTAARFIAQT